MPPPVAVTVAGYVEAYYEASLERPSNGLVNLRAFDDHERSPTISNAVVDVKGESGPVTVRLTANLGDTGASTVIHDHVQQASAAYAAPHGVLVEAGVFPSPIGPEVFAVKDNWNWSRSDLFYGLPFFHTGGRISKSLSAHWTATLAAYGGWNSIADNNRTPSVAASAAYASARVTAQVLYFGGSERASDAVEGQAWRHLGDAYAMVAVTKSTSVGAQLDAGIEHNRVGTSRWLAGAAYGKVTLASWMYAAARADYFREHVPTDGGVTASAIFWPSAWVGSATATLAVQPADHASLRLELRHDRAAGDSYFGGEVIDDAPNRRSQTTITLGGTAWF